MQTAKGTAKLYLDGHKPMQRETRNWNIFDKCEPQLFYSGTALERSVIDNRGFKTVLLGPNLTLSFCNGSQHLVSCSVLVVLTNELS